MGGEGDVEEEPDPQVGPATSQQLGHQLELVVVDPHRGPDRRVARRDLGEAIIDGDVRLPPTALEAGRADRVVVEGPQGGIGEAEVEVLVLVSGDRHRLQRDPLEVRGMLARLGHPGPADPQARVRLEDLRQR